MFPAPLGDRDRHDDRCDGHRGHRPMIAESASVGSSIVAIAWHVTVVTGSTVPLSLLVFAISPERTWDCAVIVGRVAFVIATLGVVALRVGGAVPRAVAAALPVAWLVWGRR